jgi:putative addiction module component (TIGR02574 family)
MTATLAKEVRKLSVSEKIRLAEDLWDDVAAAGESLPVPESHKRLLAARLAAHRTAPEQALSLDEFRSQLARRL